MFSNDRRIIFTLDAGGQNLVFDAIQGNKSVVKPIERQTNAHNLSLCLASIASGFEALMEQLDEKPAAISFAFPGPADYPNGVIGGQLMAFPTFEKGVALGAYLEDRFQLPVYINNDADLFAYGEALGGVLPEINQKLSDMNCAKQYRNLIGFTFGSGFGMGFVSDGKLHIGDNSCVEVYCLPHKKLPDMQHDIIVEEGVSARAITRLYAGFSGNNTQSFQPIEVFKIAEGILDGDRNAALQSFETFGEVAGDMIAYAASMIDGIIVIGGGLSKASKYFMPALLKELRNVLYTFDNKTVKKVPSYVYNLDDKTQFAEFVKEASIEIEVLGSTRRVIYHPHKRLGIILSQNTSHAVALGAYAYALAKMRHK